MHGVDVYGDYRATCMRSGRVQIRASTVEKVWARVFREAGAVVKRSKLVRDMHVGDMRASKHKLDQRRVDLVAYGLPIFNGLPIACDATLVSPLTGAGEPVPNACKEYGAAMQVARERKQKQYPEFFNQSVPHATFMVLPCEVGGRWGEECLDIVKLLAKCRVQSVPKVLRRSLEYSYTVRWWSMLSVAVHSAISASLMDEAVYHFPDSLYPDPGLAAVMSDTKYE